MARYFTEDHEWLEVEGDQATVGITAHAAEQLGELVFVELKDQGEAFSGGDDMAVVESVKAASDVYAPLDCEILEANQAIVDTPTLINESPEAEGWFYKIRIANAGDLDGLMDAEAYQAHIG